MEAMTATCLGCGEAKAPSDLSDRRKSTCKPCYLAVRRQQYAADPERHRRYARESAGRHRDRKQAATRAWHARNPERARELRDAWTQANPERVRIVQRAARAVRRAIKAGLLVRAGRCEECGSTQQIQAAHADYSLPLDVRWLCRSCHGRWDRIEPKTMAAAR